MTEFHVIALLLCLLIDGVYGAMAWADADFFSNCPPSRCSKHGPEIRYPFRLESSNTSSRGRNLGFIGIGTTAVNRFMG